MRLLAKSKYSSIAIIVISYRTLLLLLLKLFFEVLLLLLFLLLFLTKFLLSNFLVVCPNLYNFNEDLKTNQRLSTSVAFKITI